MKLILEDKTVIEGKSFGADVSTSGEVVFNTGMVGYVETLTDPSYRGQILVLTYPLVGNYGVPDAEFFESKGIHLSGLIVSEYSETYSSATAKQSLSAWLKAHSIPAITGVDTRALTKKLREKGVMLGVLTQNGKVGKIEDPNERNLVAEVSIKEKRVYGKGSTTIVAVDCGMKENIVRSLVRPGISVLRVPWNYDFTKEKYDGLFISNGPGDPMMCTETIENLQKAFKIGKPILGICLGNQLLALAAGATTYKLKYGHRSQNQPCTDVLVGTRCYITSQNHGYAINKKTLPKDWKVWFENANDGSIEGIKHTKKPWSAVQFHPEAHPGPTDTAWVFDEFLKSVALYKKNHA
ncbi:MAG: glutamine-hydrolyzing carbamoyl-phosphate synthase small subunit [Patescibacteria group bacterium]